MIQQPTPYDCYIFSSPSVYGVVYKVNDIFQLRSTYRVVGHLIGAIPAYPSQTEFTGSPLLLSPEEVTLLLRQNIITILDGDCAPCKPSEEEISKFFKNRKETMEMQMNEMLEYRKEKAEFFSKNILNASEKDEKMKEQHQKNKTELEGSEQICINSVSTRKNTSSTLQWTFPITEEENHRYIVFEDLWTKGFYLTNGSKFGGDFLAYSGDPLQYHAHYVIIVKYCFEELTPLDVISYGRLGVTVKKTPVLASVFKSNSSEKSIVSYFSIDWQGVT